MGLSIDYKIRGEYSKGLEASYLEHLRGLVPLNRRALHPCSPDLFSVYWVHIVSRVSDI